MVFFYKIIGIRGGVAQVSKRYAEANNVYMNEGYDSNKETSYLAFLDCNSLYATSMLSHPLPRKDFRWIDERDINKIIEMTKTDENFGAFLEIDIHCPRHLHDLHSVYPFLPIKQIPPGSKVPKLLLTLENKTKYVIHISMLEYALEQGLILTHIHRVLAFYQDYWLKPFIELNTYHRVRATNDFDKTIFKLMSNSIFGKCIEGSRDRVNVKVRDSWEGRYQVRNMVAAPNFKKVYIFNENLVGVEMHQTEIFLNKPVFIGAAILEISRKLMYEFMFSYLKPKYGEKVELLYTDTDSFVIQLTNIEDYYKDMREDCHMYDTSEFPVNNPYNIVPQNKKIPGLFKSEVGASIITHFVALRAKLYSIRVQNQANPIKKAKGVRSYVLKRSITFDDYVKCLRENCTISKTQNSIRSVMHQVYTISQNKIVLNGADDKRAILPCGIKTLPYGHYKLLEQQQQQQLPQQQHHDMLATIANT